MEDERLAYGTSTRNVPYLDRVAGVGPIEQMLDEDQADALARMDVLRSTSPALVDKQEPGDHRMGCLSDWSSLVR
jgi:hypothetical protein